MNHDQYLARLGLDVTDIETLDRETLERLQQAHVTTIPFETLSITGDPFGEWDGSKISLSTRKLYSKIIGGRRGGFCYELNGLFGWLLSDLGFDVTRVSARIKTDGEFGPPADHLTLIVELDDRYLVDVGFGTPKLRRPLPLNGTSHVDTAGIGWRISTSERPDAEYVVEYRPPNQAEWATRCIFREVPRMMDYFRATCEYFERAPESHFTGEPIIIIATDRGHTKLTPGTLTRTIHGDSTEQTIDRADWYRLLDEEFGVAFPPESSADNPSDTQPSHQ